LKGLIELDLGGQLPGDALTLASDLPNSASSGRLSAAPGHDCRFQLAFIPQAFFGPTRRIDLGKGSSLGQAPLNIAPFSG